MNATRRKQISRLLSRIQEAASELETIRDTEREAVDAMPEGLQGSEQYEKAEQAADALDSVVDSLEQVVSELEGITEG